MRRYIASAILIFFVVGCTSLSVTKSNDTVKIIRDEYGTPHIYADSVHDLFFGYGYAVAQDRLYQMEMARHSTQGTVAEVLGEEYADYDEQTRRLFLPSSIHQQLDALPAEDRDVFVGYAAGMNALIKEIEDRPSELLPKEFTDNEFLPSMWSAYDVAMIFVGTMANRFGDFNTELENAEILSLLTKRHGKKTAAVMFDDLNPRRYPGAPTTIDSADWPIPADDAVTQLALNAPLPTPKIQHFDTGTVISGFSNCFVLGPDKSSGANAILVNGPQFGWYVPAYVYSVGLHGAGFDIVGNTPFAYPVILFGHNADIAWGSTWGAGDIVDIYQEQLNPDNPEQYLFKGSYRNFDSRSETINIKGAAPRSVTVQRSIHGPVIAVDSENSVAYTKRRSWDGKELQSLLSWMHSGRTDNPHDWLKYAEQPALNINWYYADRRGNIAYSFVGHYPRRSNGHDNRLPAIGDGSMEWKARQSFATQPKVINPTTGYIANWNNKPADGVLNPDEHWYSWSTADRVEYLQDTIESKETFTPDQAWDLVEFSSYADVNILYFQRLIAQAADSSTGTRVTRASEFLLDWDGHGWDRNGDGNYDQPQAVFFQAVLEQLLEDVLADDLGEAFKWFSGTGYPTPARATPSGINISTGLKTLVEALNGTSRYDFLNGQKAETVVGNALSSVFSRTSNGLGDDPEQWRMTIAPRPYSNKNFLGIPQAGSDSAMVAPIEQNRGTENNMMVMQAEKIIGYEVVPPGQSGFINPSGERHEHYQDQFEMYNTFGRKRLWFYPEDVEANKKSESVITVSTH